ncbi:MAG: T9SS C-terminal target domain-containing protein [Saprospirales bacterium]|nr:MAG: T9SS C-terminal target domain-containing protein [Saprospirales bacterium]
MMKEFSFLLVLFSMVILPFIAQGQITVSPHSLPQVGDTLRQMVDNLPVGATIGNGGPDQVWDYSTLQGMYVLETIFHPRNHGRYNVKFPDANAVLFLSGGIESYFQLGESEMKEVGVSGGDPLNLDLNLIGNYMPPIEGKRAEITYGDSFRENSSLVFPISVGQLPDTLFADFPFTPDSIRLRVQISREEIVDAWGLLLIREAMFEVIRLKRIENSVSRIDVKTGFFPWVDISDLMGIDELGEQRSVSYFYYDEFSKEPILTLSLDEEENISRADYIFNEVTSADVFAGFPDESGLYVSPNPSYGFIALSFINLNPGRYKVRILNILGVTKWEANYRIDGNKREMVNISHLEAGTYLYSLVDAHNNIISTRRLVILRP